MFVLDAGGRIVRENDPDQSQGPRFAMLGCAEGNLGFVRQDVVAANTLIRIAEDAPPWFEEEAPSWTEIIAARLAPIDAVSVSLIFALPNDSLRDDPRLVRSGTERGDRLLDSLARDGPPPHLAEAGFAGVQDFWAPWCAVVEDGEITAMAFTARLGETAAEIGVYTFPRWRGRGLAPLATAGWSGMAELRDRELFYSVQTTNASSRRVAARLGLTRIGMGLRIT